MAACIPTLKRRTRQHSLVGFDRIESLDPSVPDEARMLDRIYETLMLCGSMRTFRGRFQQLDQEVAEIVGSFEPSTRVVRIHDVAASNAITTVDLFEKIANLRDRDIHVTASDLCTTIDIYPVSPRWRVIHFGDLKRQTGKDWIQAVGRGVVVNANLPLKKVGYGKLMFSLNWIMSVYVDLFVLKDFRKRKSTIEKKTISLFHPHALKLAARESRFKLKQYDLFEPSPEQYEVVRAMTVLGSLSGQDFQRAVRSLADSVVSGGYLIVGFGKRQCSIFRKHGDRILPYKDVGAPFKFKQEIERLYS